MAPLSSVLSISSPLAKRRQPGAGAAPVNTTVIVLVVLVIAVIILIGAVVCVWHTKRSKHTDREENIKETTPFTPMRERSIDRDSSYENVTTRGLWSPITSASNMPTPDSPTSIYSRPTQIGHQERVEYEPLEQPTKALEPPPCRPIELPAAESSSPRRGEYSMYPPAPEQLGTESTVRESVISPISGHPLSGHRRWWGTSEAEEKEVEI